MSAARIFVVAAIALAGCTGGFGTITGAGGAGDTGGAGATTAGAGGAPGGGGAGSGGGSGTGGRAGAPGGGSGGAAGAGAGGSPGGAPDGGLSGGDAGIGGPSLCSPGRYVICEDFEATAVGAIPAGWTRHGNAAVAADQVARGAHSLKISAAVNGERRIYANAMALGSGHWGRIFYRVQLPAPVSSDPQNMVLHSTIVALQGVGPTTGSAEYRVVDTVENLQGMHQFLYNVQPSGDEFGTGSPYNWRYEANWHCAEWHIDNPTQSYHFYIDGVEVTRIALDNGAGNYNGTDIPPIFSQVRVGWNNYQTATLGGFVAWVDEVALDPSRIGCGN